MQALVCFDGESRADDLWLKIGLHSVGHALDIRQDSEGSGRKSKIAVFDVPPGVVTDGRNELIVRSERVSATILGIDVCMR